MCDSSPAAYIHMVQHMIETCLILNLSKEECMEALSKNANINPLITSTVWKELVKENKEFFKMYEQKHMKNEPMSEEKELMKENKEFFKTYEQKHMKNEPMSEEETNQMIQNIISGSSDD